MSKAFRLNKTSAMILMAAVMIARGSSFIFSKWLMDDIEPMNVLAVRFVLAFLFLACIFYKKLLALDKRTLLKGLALGGLYTLCMVAEMYGLRLIDAGTSSFIENSAIVIVPFYLAVGTRTLPGRKSVVCAIIAFIGVGFLTVSNGLTVNKGIILAIIAALVYGMCIIVTDIVARDGDPITIGILQIGFMGLFSTILSLLIEHPRLPGDGTTWGMILMLALICSCFGFTFQPLAQKYLNANITAVFAAINPLTTTVLGILLKEESASLFKWIGGAFIITAVLIEVLKEEKDEEKK